MGGKYVVREIVGEKGRAEFVKMVEEHELGSIHQLPEWGEFQVAAGSREKMWLVGVFESGRLVGGCMMVKVRLPFGLCWLYCPRGPLIDYGDEEMVRAIIAFVGRMARAERAVFWRIDPALVELGPEGVELEGTGLMRGVYDEMLLKNGFVGAHAHYQPEDSLMVDLSFSEAEILGQMKSKGRYNIRLAEKRGVKVIEAAADEVGVFHDLLGETVARDGFAGHSRRYYEEMLVQLGDKVKLLLAEYDGGVVAGLIATYFGGQAIYYFGASGNKHRQVMAPYLLQWEAMLEAKRRGCLVYDFLGVAPEGAGEGHAWAGVTGFKEKFGGKRVKYRPAREMVFKPAWYWVMRVRKGILAA